MTDASSDSMRDPGKPRGYLLIHQDWYELPDEDDLLLRHAEISTLNPGAFVPGGEAQLLKHCYRILEVPGEMPTGFTIGEGVSVGEPHYETLDGAKDRLRELGVRDPRIGFNPIG